MMMLQLDPALPVYVEGRGKGYALLVTDYSQEHDRTWTVALDSTGEIWDVPNPGVRMRWNWTMGRRHE